MTDLWLPDVRIASAAPRLMDNTGRFSSPLSGTMRTVSRPGDRWGVRLEYANLTAFDRSRMEAFIARMRGAANRVLWSPSDFPQRGSFPSAEKLVNNNFLTGTNGWSVSGGTLTATDRRLRLTFSGGGTAEAFQTCGLVTNLPHVARYFLVDGKGTPLALGALTSYFQGSVVTASVTSIEGLNVITLVPDASSGGQYPFYPTSGSGNIPTGQIAGNYAEAVWTSLTQCMLIDNGPNLLEFSDTLASPWGAFASSVTANAATAADGTATAAAITDTTSNVAHYVSQGSLTVPAGVADFMVCGEFKAVAQNFLWLSLVEGTGSTAAVQFFNLSTGALASSSVGSNWANLRSVIRPLGNGWYYCAMVARKTNAATSLTVQLGPSNSGSSSSYAGAGTAATDARRVTCSQSSVPGRQVQSAGAAVAATAQTGSAYYVKGLPVSTAGLLLPGDWIDVDRELKRVTNQLDSDAAGLGYLQFSPPIRTSANDNDPVIVNVPMGRFVLSNNQNGWQATPGPNAQPFGTYSLDLVEAAA
ncbi:MAG TPA: hypothetical protein VK803_08025 [Steroidobacteraceae bacterium]|nr:hypothetical protein [Steroidobacteraceae bacterium]